ncbi:MAG: tryptophan 7-halogenase [Thermoflavifilum sp.]|nr:tryptophan 7-halogenase [Thermoflavifilum sp.]
MNLQDHCRKYDIVVAGAGFAGSLAALVLHQLGFRVCLIEKGKHPRFAIGESSTPAADMILRRLAKQYDLPWLHVLSRYGTWCQTYPHIMRGLKRGFSFYKHHPGQIFYTDVAHSHELLVAASANDEQSDTNWLRADFDAFFVEQVQQAGIDYLDMTEICEIETTMGWTLLQLQQAQQHRQIQARLLIDATGGPQLLQRCYQIPVNITDFQTHSFAVFSHFQQVPLWETCIISSMGYDTNDYPYRADFSALHHLLDEGWMWMLRFDDGRVSIGIVLNGHLDPMLERSPEQIWQSTLSRYPSLQALLSSAQICEHPGRLLRSGRLQRRLLHVAGPGWVALPHTAGFIDPLFSPGNAHSLSGLERVIDIIVQHGLNTQPMYEAFHHYGLQLQQEWKLIDQLIAGCYATMPHMELFIPWSAVYFACTLAYEQHRLQDPMPEGFLLANRPEIQSLVTKASIVLKDFLKKKDYSVNRVAHFNETIRQLIAPFNRAGLLDPALKNMYSHTAANL